MLVKDPDEVGPFSCQKADLAGSQVSPLGMESCYSLIQSPPFTPPFTLKKKKSQYACLIPVSPFNGFCSSVFLSVH